MKERPILFSGPMVRAILGGHKTQTRRVAKFTAGGHLKETGGHRRWHRDDPDAVLACPYGQPGDQLWVRETFAFNGERFIYRADQADDTMPPLAIQAGGKWKPSIFCTRAASRITLEIVGVRVERLNEISEADARAEGCPLDHLGNHYEPPSKEVDSWQGYGRGSYSLLWSKINGPGSWDANPLVWVLTFKRA